ncbi:MAG: histone deacetylase [Planctomycetaceae bacterium]|nr:histone deacetylase [Planctomycetaceae bacterium]
MVLLFSDPIFEQHDTGTHPENSGRLVAIRQELERRSLPGNCERQPPQLASPDQIERVHPSSHLRSIQRVADAGGGRLDPDTVVSPKSPHVAEMAAGTACEAVRQVAKGDASSALCLIRPPGHHALADRAMGFCLLNHIAIAARHAQEEFGLERILIVDWDVHHGNGTQDIFYRDPHVVFCSIHRFPFYPGTGDSDETGTGDGLGATFNVPIRYGTPREEYFARFVQGLEAAAERAKPQLVLISAGFDAHREDPIGSLDLETEDFIRLTQHVADVARQWCDGKIVSFLEGGYDPRALAESVAVHLECLCRQERQAEDRSLD